MLRLKGPKDEGLALRKKCEEISRHLSGPSPADEKKPSGTGYRPRGSRQNPCCTTSSRAKLSLEQIDALLGTDLLNYIPDRSLLKAGKNRRPRHDTEEKEIAIPVSDELPAWAISFDALAHFMYKHGFHDPAQGDTRLRRTFGGVPRSHKSNQEVLLKAGILRTLAMLLKNIHNSNFYRSPHDKLANAFTISLEKKRVDREGLSADWEFYGANHHPKIPLKDKIAHAKISKQLLDHTAKRSASSTCSRVGLSSMLVEQKKHEARGTSAVLTEETKGRISKLAISNSSKPQGRQASTQLPQTTPLPQARDRKRRFRITNKQNCDKPLHILGLAQTPKTPDSNDKKSVDIKERPLSANVATDSANAVESDSSETSSSSSDLSTDADAATASISKSNVCEGGKRRSALRPSAAGETKEERRWRSCQKRRTRKNRITKRGVLKSLILDGMSNSSSRAESYGGRSTLTRIECMFQPIPKERAASNGRAQVELERLKILRW